MKLPLTFKEIDSEHARQTIKEAKKLRLQFNEKYHLEVRQAWNGELHQKECKKNFRALPSKIINLNGIWTAFKWCECMTSAILWSQKFPLPMRDAIHVISKYIAYVEPLSKDPSEGFEALMAKLEETAALYEDQIGLGGFMAILPPACFKVMIGKTRYDIQADMENLAEVLYKNYREEIIDIWGGSEDAVAVNAVGGYSVFDRFDPQNHHPNRAREAIERHRDAFLLGKFLTLESLKDSSSGWAAIPWHVFSAAENAGVKDVEVVRDFGEQLNVKELEELLFYVKLHAKTETETSKLFKKAALTRESLA